MEYLILFTLWFWFYLLHSFFADMKIKRKFKRWLGPKFIWYRLGYSLFASVHFFGIFLFAATLNESMAFEPLATVSYFGYMLATFGTIILVRSFQHFKAAEFVGLRPIDEFTKSDRLVLSGLHAYVRHPIYSGLLLIFAGYILVQPVLSSFVHFVMLVAYLPIGIYLEEKKLIEKFGDDYLDYKSRVSALVPRKK